MLQIRKILCPIDFSEASLQGLEEAIEYAVHFEAELCLTHIIYNGIPLGADAAGYFALLPELQEIPHHNVEKKLQEITSELRAQGVRTSYVIGTGETGLGIVKFANELQADLIIIGTHGWTGWKRIIFGSVAEKVMRYARCQVLTVPVRQRNVKKIPGKRIPVAPALTDKRLAAAARLKLGSQTAS